MHLISSGGLRTALIWQSNIRITLSLVYSIILKQYCLKRAERSSTTLLEVQWRTVMRAHTKFKKNGVIESLYFTDPLEVITADTPFNEVMQSAEAHEASGRLGVLGVR